MIPAGRIRIFAVALLAAAAVPALAHDRAVDDRVNHGRGDSRYERDLRAMEAYERQKKVDAYEASQGGRSKPGSPGDQPFNNPRPSSKPLPLLQQNPYRK